MKFHIKEWNGIFYADTMMEAQSADISYQVWQRAFNDPQLVGKSDRWKTRMANKALQEHVSDEFKATNVYEWLTKCPEGSWRSKTKCERKNGTRCSSVMIAFDDKAFAVKFKMNFLDSTTRLAP